MPYESQQIYLGNREFSSERKSSTRPKRSANLGLIKVDPMLFTVRGALVGALHVPLDPKPARARS